MKHILHIMLLSFVAVMAAYAQDNRKLAEEMDGRACAAFEKVRDHAIRDSLAICRAVADGVDFTLRCDEYDRMPNRSGLVKTRFESRNAERLAFLHPRLVEAGRYMEENRDAEGAERAYRLYMDAADSPLLKDTAAESGVAAYRMALIRLKARDYAEADRYADMALSCDETAQGAAEVKARCMAATMKTPQDSAKYLMVLDRLYETDPTNETYFAWLMDFYDSPSQRHRLENFVDRELETNTDSPVPWLLKGELAMHARRWDEAADAYKHADDIDPGSVPVMFNIAVCLNSKATETWETLKKEKGDSVTKEDSRELMQMLAESRTYLERVREKDPRRDKVDWVKPLYMVYAALGEKDKAGELKPIVTGFKGD